MINSEELIRECNMMYDMCKARLLQEKAENRHENAEKMKEYIEVVEQIESERNSMIKRGNRFV